MYSFVSKKTVPFVLSAAVAFSAFTGVIATPVTNDTPLAVSTAYELLLKLGIFHKMLVLGRIAVVITTVVMLM